MKGSRVLKFCFVSNWYPPDNFAGSGVFIYHLAHALVNRGHQVTVLYCRDSYRLRSKGRGQSNMPQDPRIRIVRLEHPLGALAPLTVHQTGRPLLNHFALKRFFREDFDVIHFHNISLIGGAGIYRYGKGIKLATLHDYWLICPLSTLYKYGKEICREKECIRCALGTRKPPQWWRYTSLMQAGLNHLNALISPSEFLKGLHEAEGVSRRIFHIPNFVTPVDAEMRDTGERPFSKGFFLVAGRLEKNKGVQQIIPAFRHGRHGDLLVAGDGSYRNELQRVAWGCPHVRFLGYLSQVELMRYYRSALAVVVPSLWYENCPMVILDAMRMGIPIIAHDIAGPGEMVRKSGAGMLYQDEEGLDGCLRRMRETPDMRREFSDRGRAYFEGNYTEEAHLARYFSVIQAVSRAA
jgi:glycosyltransferase involved in cell wall biosynthesis